MAPHPNPLPASQGEGVLLLITLLIALPASAEGRRFGLVVGENRGLAAEEQLRFAETDARKVKEALVDVGGFAAQDVTAVAGADATTVRTALTRLRESMGPGPHERLIIYVSSHSGDGMLHLAGTELPLQELVDFMRAAPVQVGLLVIDACQSGRVTQLKGLKATGVPATRIEASGVEGRVLISASGADEYAQESDALQGSYFTHYLVTGLRGAADTSRDGKVTLDEVYGWAWARTIEATFSSRGGVQRPAFSVDLRGAGQLILAEPQRSVSRLTLDVRAPGRWLVVSEATGSVFADVDKAEGPVSLALPPGSYRVQLRVPDGVMERVVVVPATGGATLTGGDLEQASLLRVARKGGEETRLVISAGAGIASGFLSGLVVQPGAELRVRRDGYLLGPLNQLSAAFAWREGTSATFHQTELELRLGTGHRFSWSRASLALGVETGPMLILQDGLPDGTARTSLGLALALALEGRVRLVGPLEFFVHGTAGGAVVKKLTGTTLAPRLGGTVGLALGF
ncbi:MAG: caspase family protein [Archangium sp.]|nr:caspase family protein [Archangium sp.]MDP3573780.1 caspase family protein [Archangium sp.]